MLNNSIAVADRIEPTIQESKGEISQHSPLKPPWWNRENPWLPRTGFAVYQTPVYGERPRWLVIKVAMVADT